MLRARPSRKTPAGFTLVELMVVVAVIAVSATLAAPDLSRLVANYRIRGEAESILNGLNFARGEAVRRNTAVTFALSGGTGGWTVRQLLPDTPLQSHANADPSGTTVTSSTVNTSVTFLATGLLQSGSQLSQVTVASGAAATGTRRINIFGGGLIRMCEPAITTANDPRRC